MKLKLKSYKFYKLKHLIKTPSLFFIYHTNSLTAKSWQNLEQKLIKLNLKYYKIQNKLFNKVLKKSKYKNLIALINGPIIFIYPKNNNLEKLSLNSILNLDTSLQFICCKLNDKFYLLSQIKNLKTFNYKQNNIKFVNLIKSLIKVTTYKLKKLN